MPESIDYKFISDREGGSKITGYVPAVSVSKSGVTIATGFDLGARNEQDLKNLKLDVTLIAKLKPYLLLQKADAQEKLKKTQLMITAMQAKNIDIAVKKISLEKLKTRYNIAPGNKKKFIDLPSQAQTVIASVEFQYGNCSVKAPKFWKAVTAQNWSEAIKILKAFGDAYPSRRKLEAALLEKIQ